MMPWISFLHRTQKKATICTGKTFLVSANNNNDDDDDDNKDDDDDDDKGSNKAQGIFEL